MSETADTLREYADTLDDMAWHLRIQTMGGMAADMERLAQRMRREATLIDANGDVED